MTAPVPTEAHLRAQVGHLLAGPDADEVRAVAILADPTASYPEKLHVRGRTARIVACASVLAVHEALASIDGDGDGIVVILTDRHDLGSDIAARVARHRLVRIDTWRVVLDLFRANPQLDRKLADAKWLAEALVEAAPPGGYPPVAGGVLTYPTAMAALLSAALGISGAAVDVDSLIAWAVGPDAVRFGELAEGTRDGIEEWAAAHGGGAAALVLKAAEAGHGADAVALGLVCDVLFPADGEQSLRCAQAAARLEDRFGGTALDAASGRALAEAAIRYLSRSRPDKAHDAATARCDEILVEVGADAEAWRSDYSLNGFEQRLIRYGTLLDAGGAETEAAAALVMRSRHGRYLDTRKRGVQMSLRLLRRLSIDTVDDTGWGVAELAARYVDDGGWAAWAREVLWRSESIAELASAYATVRDMAQSAAEEESRRFAAALAGWVEAGSRAGDPLEIAAVAETVIGPLAKQQPVLVIVLDAMSFAVYRELLDEDEMRAWRQLAPEGRDRMTCAIAVAPSLTRTSRATLLAGRLCDIADQGGEKKAFAACPPLVAASSRARPPILFHKSELDSDKTRDAIADPDQRVVGAVVNVVDDLLDKGDQVDIEWESRIVSSLRVLLQHAARAGRVVVLTSDHGHVIDHGDFELRSAALAEGARWRRGPDASADEVRLAGPLVQVPGGAAGGPVVCAAVERLRYTPKKAGYHGGATPAEMVVPVGVLAPAGVHLDGWGELGPQQPPWWDAEPVEREPVAVSLVEETGQIVFPVAEEADHESWIDRLLASETWQAQREGHPRIRIPDDDVRAALAALDAEGGVLTRAAFVRRTGTGAARLDGHLASLRNLLNLDGVLVLETDGYDVRLNRDLLVAQFLGADS